MTPLRPHVRRTPAVLAAVATLAVAAMITTATVSRGATPQASTLTQAFARIEHKSIYRQSTWGYDVLDQRTGQVLASCGIAILFAPPLGYAEQK